MSLPNSKIVEIELMEDGIYDSKNIHITDLPRICSVVVEFGDCAAAFFQARGDGEKGDDFVSYPYVGPETVKDFMIFLRERMPDLTERQLEALEAAYTGPKNKKTNEQIYCGLPIGSEPYSGYLREPAGIVKKLGYPWFRLFFGQDFEERKFDFSDDVDKMKEGIGEDFTANNPDLTDFNKIGGKFIVYSGSADPAGPWADAVKYYNRVCAQMGGYEKVKNFFKYFIMPGKSHADGGRGTNVFWGNEDRISPLDALRNWYEKGEEPEYFVAAHIKKDEEVGSLKFIRRVYPYKADKEEIESFPKACDNKYLS